MARSSRPPAAAPAMMGMLTPPFAAAGAGCVPTTAVGLGLELLVADCTLPVLLLLGSTAWLVVLGAFGNGLGPVGVVVVVVAIVAVGDGDGDGDEEAAGVTLLTVGLLPVNTRPFCLHTFSAVSKTAAAWRQVRLVSKTGNGF